ncbi:hypothetical protein CSAL01_08900 [Colletotrichum salicis]|uniref:Uncharacterized protein n=1 Tax=Colletotrichum salicis TaxID=1209931 RepID=A0A135V3N7_9PEZI|nr:hypothetical protein CSAL01_08900 [Colletotrichum salicis]
MSNLTISPRNPPNRHNPHLVNVLKPPPPPPIPHARLPRRPPRPPRLRRPASSNSPRHAADPRGSSQSRFRLKAPTASASGSRRLELGNILPAAAAAAAVDDAGEEEPPRDQQHHLHSKAEGGGDKVSAAAEEQEENDNNNNDNESEDEEWPASANREYLTAYAKAASKARWEAIGSWPFLPPPSRYFPLREISGKCRAKGVVHSLNPPTCIGIFSIPVACFPPTSNTGAVLPYPPYLNFLAGTY